MPNQRPDQSKRNRRHDDHRLGITAELNRQQAENRHQRNDGAGSQTSSHILLVSLFAFKIIGQSRVLFTECSKHLLFQVRNHFVAGRNRQIHIGGYTDHAAAVGTIDGSVTAPQLHGRDLLKRNFRTVFEANPHVFNIRQRGPLALGIANHDADIIPAALDPLDLVTIETLPHLSG